MTLLKVGVFGTSLKENEKRVPIHPDQLSWIDEKVRKNLIFEEKYGLPFDYSDEMIKGMVGGIASRKDLFKECDIILLPKPVEEDLLQMKKHSILWGWPHCVQQQNITQIAIDRKLTLIAWEAMHKWNAHGDWQMHIFHNNNEMAGYAGVMHALKLAGMNGNYGPHRKAVIISFGSVSRGAILALKGLGFHDITVFTQRHFVLVADQIHGIDYYNFEQQESGELISLHPDRHSLPFIEELADADIIVNGILQNTNYPMMFVKEDEITSLKRGCLIIDVSCDEGMGFPFAKPTSFSNPMFKVGQVKYYAVDHTPSYLWNSASWEISNSLLPYLPIVMGGPDSWKNNETISRAIEIRDGIIENSDILNFQNREGL
jgi:alanine dehydrogenase